METTEYRDVRIRWTRSYRTYEEWKHKFTVLTLSGLPVLTVPMRNGNIRTMVHRSKIWKFLPYLWGMETNHKDLKLRTSGKFLPYLWGMETLIQWSESKKIEKVLTVPMRNGNNPCATPQKSFGRHSSYRTYEEWKLTNRPHCLSNLTVLTVPMRNGNHHIL